MIELNSNQKGYNQIIQTIKEGFTQFFMMKVILLI